MAVDVQYMQLLQARKKLGQLDTFGEKLLETFEVEYAKQQEYLDLAKDNVKEIEIFAKTTQVEATKAEVAAFKASGSAEIMSQAIHTPGYITIQTIPQVNTAVANYNTMVANIVRNNPQALTDPAQVAQLPFTRLDMFTLGRHSKASCDPIVEAEKSVDVKDLEELTTEYEVAIRRKFGENFDMNKVENKHIELIRTEQLEMKKEAEKNGEHKVIIRDMLDIKGKADEQAGRLPPAVQKAHGPDQGKDTGAIRF